MKFVAQERTRYTVYPPPEQVFTWTQMCDIWDVSRAVPGSLKPGVGAQTPSFSVWFFKLGSHGVWMLLFGSPNS